MRWIFLSIIATLLAITNINAQTQSTLEELEQQLSEATAQLSAAQAKADEAEAAAVKAEAEALKAATNAANAKNISEEVELGAIAREKASLAKTEREKVSRAKAEAESAETKVQELKPLLQREQQYLDAMASAEENVSLKRYEEALTKYREAISLKPGNYSFISQKISEIEKILNEPAQLYIYRKREITSFLGGKQYDISLGGVIICRSKSNWKVPEPLTINTFGTTTLSAEIDGKAEVQINIEPGGVYYLRSGIDSKTRDLGTTTTTKSILTGKPITTKDTETLYTPVLEIVSETIGSSEYNKIKANK